jgi:protein-disulfide isomerase
MRRRSAPLLLLALAAGASAQRPPEVVPCAAFGSDPPPCASPTPAPKPLAIVEGDAITLQDLDPKLRADVEALDAAVPNARRNAVRAAAEDALLEAEAARRRVPVEALLDDELLARLEKANPIELGVDPSTPGLPPTTVLATVAGRKLTRAELQPRLDAAAFRASAPVRHREASAVEKLVHERLLRLEAKSRGVAPEEVTRLEVTQKLTSPTEAEVAAAYAKFRAFFPRDLEMERPSVVAYLNAEKRHDAETALDGRLRQGRDVRILLEPVRPPAVPALFVDGSPSRGPASAAVTFVEFGDFQCPPCRVMHPIVDEAWTPYASRVRFVFRQYPMDLHAFARKAAEAALAADAQGKFFEYAHHLFAHQDALDVPSLKRYASELGLDRARFDADLDGGRFAARVKKDRRDGEAYGILGTPAFFVNGVPVEGMSYSVEGLRALLDAALARGAPSR